MSSTILSVCLTWKIVNRKDKLLLAFPWMVKELYDLYENIMWVCNFLRVIIVSLGNYSFWLFYRSVIKNSTENDEDEEEIQKSLSIFAPFIHVTTC